MNILFADDSNTIARPVIEFLERQGYRVTHVRTGREAVAAYQNEMPDLVLMDVVMPDMNGIEATRRIKALGGARWVPVLIMTGLSSQHEIIEGFDAGADDYLVKPIVFEVLAARMRSMQRIAVMQASLFGILDNVFEGIITIDTHGTVQSYNQAAERIFGYSAVEIIGSNISRLMPTSHGDQHDRYLCEPVNHVLGVVRKVKGRRKNGEVFPMRLAVTEVKRIDGSLFIGLVSDISEEETARQRIEFLAWHDPLTGLPNRAYFNETLDAALKDPLPHAVHALLFIDLDGFKPINDSLGHEAGDEALRIIAGRLRHSLAAEDFVARLGGDEFVALVRNINTADTARSVAQRLLDSIRQPLIVSGMPRQLSASIGVVLVPQRCSQSVSEALTQADNAMYAAKRAGKSQIVFAECSA